MLFILTMTLWMRRASPILVLAPGARGKPGDVTFCRHLFCMGKAVRLLLAQLFAGRQPFAVARHLNGQRADFIAPAHRLRQRFAFQ